MAEVKTYIAGTVTAYGAAVKGGYTGTYEEFCAQQAAFAENAAQVAEDREAVEAAAETFTGTTVPEATQAIQTAGAAQVAAVEQEGETQRSLIQTAGEGAVSDVQAAGAAQIQDIQDEGADQIEAVDAAGAAQISAVGTEGQTQISAVQAKGTEVIGSIPADYTELTDEVSDLKSQISYQSDIGFNIWDEAAEKGGISSSTGKNYTADNIFRSKNYIPVHPSTIYYFKAPDNDPGNCFIYFYDEEQAYISNVEKKNAQFTTPANCYYIRFRTTTAGTGVYNNDVCINLYQGDFSFSPHNGDYLPYRDSALFQKVMQNKTAVININDIINRYNLKNILEEIGSFPTTFVNNGVTYAWNDDHTVITATSNGATSELSICNIYYDLTNLPAGIAAGKDYPLFMESSNDNLRLETLFYLDGATTGGISTKYHGNGFIRIPANCTGFVLRVSVPAGSTLTDATISNIQLVTTGITYPISSVDVLNSNAHDLFEEVCEFSIGQAMGVNYTFNGRSCNANSNGNVTSGVSIVRLFYAEKRLPDAIRAGSRVFVDYETTDSNLYFEARYYVSGSSSSTRLVALTKPGEFTIPQNAIGLYLRLIVDSGKKVNGTATLHYIGLAPSQNMLMQDVDNILVPYNAGLLVSFIDDDTTNNTYIERYYNACKHNGIVGNFAVIKSHLTDGDTSLDRLLEYENDGFGLLTHVTKQSNAPYWTQENRDVDLCRADLCEAIRYYRANGFIGFLNWVSPYGWVDSDFVNLARQLSLNCNITLDQGVNYPETVDRFNIKRATFRTDGDLSESNVKKYADEALAKGYGWLVVCTHFNEWGSVPWDSTEDANGYPIGYSAFNTMVQYLLGNGFKCVSYPEGWSYYSPYLRN